MAREDIILYYFNVLVLNNANRGKVKTCHAEKNTSTNHYWDLLHGAENV